MANVSINNITETWSSSGTAYTGIKYNATDSGPSAAGSKLIDLQVGGVSKFSVDKSGSLSTVGLPYVNVTSTTPVTITGLYTYSYNLVLTANATVGQAAVSSFGFKVGSSYNIGWASGNADSGADLILARDQANTLAQRNGTNPQSYRLYLSYTDTTNNYSRFAINATANYYRLASEIGTSTGSKKPIVTDIYQSTVDPTTADIPDGTSTVWKNTTSGVVKLWANNGGTLIGVALA